MAQKNQKKTEHELRRFWRKTLGFKIGEEITVTYQIPVTTSEGKQGEGAIFVSGIVKEIKEREIVLESWNGVCVRLQEDKILDARIATEKDKDELKLSWGGHLGSYVKAIKR